MQQLLTGKQRLPGFSGEWEVKRLGDVCQITSGGTPSTSVPAFWTGGIPWCTPTDITENNAKYLFRTNRTISEEGLKHSSAVLLPRGALLLCTRATVGEIKIAAVPVCTNQGFKSLVCSSDVSNEFLFYKLVTLKDRLQELGVGSTFLEVSRKDVAALEIPLPALKEQTAIAIVLSDMDAEIEALEARREKTRRIKQGMMQELLTGRTRLERESGS
jgi:type I restriction enzyme S subunit